MKKLFFAFTMMSAFVMLFSCTGKKFNYPESRKTDQTDDYFGTKVADPYRWLENDTSAETAKWVTAQNALTMKYLGDIPFRDDLKQMLTKIWDYPKFGVPFSKKGNYFYFKNDGMQNQSVLYVQKGLNAEPKVLLDPNKLSEDGTVALGDMSVSNDGKYLAYNTSTAGSDWSEIFVIEIESGKMLADHIKWVKFSSMAWKGNGFYYSRYDAPAPGKELSKKNEYQKVYYHILGENPEKDAIVWEDQKNPLRTFGAQVTEDERFLIISESESTYGNILHLKDIQNPGGAYVQIGDNFDFEYGIIDNVGEKLYVITNHMSPRKKLVVVDPKNPQPENWQTLIAEKDQVLEGVYLVGDKLISQYMQDACHHAYISDLNGKQVAELALPGPGTLGGFSCEKGTTEAFYAYTSFTYPNTIFKYDVVANRSEIFRKPGIEFNPDEYETQQVFYTSKDGTKIPMFIVHKKGLKMDGSNPTLLYGYGGFNVSLTPSFSISRLAFLQNGGVYVLANIRGGGEYGEEWHKAGTKMLKQNVFDDFIAAAEYLISTKVTSSKHLAVNGGSNGGLLIGAVLNQRPDLFAAAIPDVGVMDMLRYHKFTIGWAWASDYGTSEESEEMFKYLMSYSPLHNIKPGTVYPPVLIKTADHDDRVVPAHSFKYAATMQENQAGSAPVLIRIDEKAGHGAGKPTAKIIEEAADFWAFVMYNTGMKPSFGK